MVKQLTDILAVRSINNNNLSSGNKYNFNSFIYLTYFQVFFVIRKVIKNFLKKKSKKKILFIIYFRSI